LKKATTGNTTARTGKQQPAMSTSKKGKSNKGMGDTATPAPYTGFQRPAGVAAGKTRNTPAVKNPIKRTGGY
jgi:hypothetical protein